MANGSMTNIDIRKAHLISAFQDWSAQFEMISKSKGFMQPGELNGMAEVNIGLLHGEVSEVMECLRLPEPEMSKKIPEFFHVEEELADVIIRTFILARLIGVDGGRLAEAVIAKSKYNEGRPKMHGGKRF